MEIVCKKIIVLLFFLCSIISVNVYAEEEDTTCNYSSKTKLNKIAYSVEVGYVLKTDDNGNYYFEFSIYNITDDIYITIENDLNNDVVSVVYGETINNSYSFVVTDTVTIINYTVKVKALKYGCTNELRKITITKPRYNDLSELSVCKDQLMSDYSYCQPWVTKYFTDTREDVIEKINNQYNKNTTTTTTSCVSCESIDKANKEIESFNKLRRNIIIGLIIGIIADITVIAYLFIIIRRQKQ